MSIVISKDDAQRLVRKLMSQPIAPGRDSYFLNVGTDSIIDVLEGHYFRNNLPQGIGCFKYLEGGYGSGKTQFIHSLAQRAHANAMVSAIVDVGTECPFNSPAAIFRAVMGSFQSPFTNSSSDERGIDLLLTGWVNSKLRQFGIQTGQVVPSHVQREIEVSIPSIWIGAPDVQMSSALIHLTKRILRMCCGGPATSDDAQLISWAKGDNIKSPFLRNLGIQEPVRDETAFRRLRTVTSFLREKLGYTGFLIAFDEGTRTNSFKRGSVKQRQSIENMLTMINHTSDNGFAGVMWLYASTPDFRSEVIVSYQALYDRIGTVAFIPGSPIVPLINIETVNSRDVIMKIGERLLSVFAKAYGISWDEPIQKSNMEAIVQAQEEKFYETPNPRFFVYQYCRFLDSQRGWQRLVSLQQAMEFVDGNPRPGSDN
jgi:hypothetical protein